MMHFEWLDIALVGGVPAAVILGLILTSKVFTRGTPRGQIMFGPVAGLTLVVVILTLFSALMISAPARSSSFLFLMVGGQIVGGLASRMRSAILRRVMPWLGFAFQFGVCAWAVYQMASYGSLEAWGAFIAPAILAGLCLLVLFSPARRPAWRSVGVPIVVGVTMAAIVTFASGAQWLISLLWLGLASGPLALAWLRANAATATISDSNTSPPKAMEPTA